MKRRPWFLILLAALCTLPATAQAHFMWLVVSGEAGKQRLEVYFSESAAPDNAELLAKLQSAKGVALHNGKALALEFKLSETSLSAPLAGDAHEGDAKGIYVASCDYGVISRGGETFLLKYYAQTGPTAASPAWRETLNAKELKFHVTPQLTDQGIRLTATFDGQPAAGAQVVVEGPEMASTELELNEQGEVTFAPQGSGLYSIRARHIERTSGEVGGAKYASIRHYATVALPVANVSADKAAGSLPELPHPVTSFGGAVANGNVYIYGGHQGEAHHYYHEAQSNELWRLNLTGQPEWKKIADGPGLQGLTMVAHGGKLYRLGGFIARNSQDEERDLSSQAAAACFDPQTNVWSDLPALPEPRSSFDAAVLGDTIYVVGGWNMQGADKPQWHKTAYALDLSQPELAWKALPETPFARRALALAAYNGKLYAIGGMQAEGGATTKAAVYDPATKTWAEAPALPGEGMEGFGASAFATGGHLYVSTISGQLLRLAADGASWEKVQHLDRERFFHRMLPVSDHQLIFVGGASMKVGKFSEVDLIPVD